MRKTLWQKRIPTLLGLILIVIGIGITTYLVGTGTIISTKAGPSDTPQNIRITNITDISFTVSYTTQAQVVGSVNYGKDQSLTQTALDDRDNNGNVSPHFVHYITVKNLNPSTAYYFSITSGSKTFTKDGNLYKISTGPSIGKSEALDNLIKGSIVFPSSLKEAIVYISSGDSNTVSEIVSQNGNYSVLLNILRNKDLTSYFDFNQNSVFNMLVVGGDSVSNVKFTIPQNGELAPVTLSQDFDFTQENVAVVPQSFEENFSNINLQTLPAGTTPQIITPKENQEFVDLQPRFTGTASPNSVIDITIHSDDNLKAQVTVDARGNWSYRPPSALSPGQHTITIIARGASGILRTVTQTFTIFESGTQVAQSATPSATPIPTTPPGENLTPAPTSILVPTSTLTPTQIPLITPIATVSPPPPISKPGSSFVLLGIIGIGITSLGSLILLYNRYPFL